MPRAASRTLPRWVRRFSVSSALNQPDAQPRPGVRGELVAGLLSAPPVKARLKGALVDMGAQGSARASPLVADAVRVIGIRDARAILRGRPSAATAYLRSAMGARVIEVLAPDLGAALRMLDDPLVSGAVLMLAGFDIASASRSFAREAEEVIWRTMRGRRR